MRITILVDNNTCIDQYYLAEPALSFYIEADQKKILFDLGYSDVWRINAERLNLNLHDIDTIVLSHGHNDHTGGLRYLQNMNQPIQLVAHPDTEKKKVYQNTDVGSFISFDQLPSNITCNYQKEPYPISEHLWYLGEIPRYYGFEGYPLEEDRLSDDSALVYKDTEGLFIITGCSHSGICNITRYAQKVFYTEKITGILGGLHLLNQKEQTLQTVKELKSLGVKKIYPCHCTDLWAKIELSKEFEIEEVYSSKVITL